jgi:hypothetical protein
MPNRYDWLVRRCECKHCKARNRVSWVGEVWDLHAGSMVFETIVDSSDDLDYLTRTIGVECLTVENKAASGLMTGSST